MCDRGIKIGNGQKREREREKQRGGVCEEREQTPAIASVSRAPSRASFS